MTNLHWTDEITGKSWCWDAGVHGPNLLFAMCIINRIWNDTESKTDNVSRLAQSCENNSISSCKKEKKGTRSFPLWPCLVARVKSHFTFWVMINLTWLKLFPTIKNKNFHKSPSEFHPTNSYFINRNCILAFYMTISLNFRIEWYKITCSFFHPALF